MPTPWDVIQLVKGTGANPHEFLEFVEEDEVTGVDKDDPTWLECNGRRYMMGLRRHKKRGCFFLNPKTKLCKAYECRPILCRLFPFKLQETKGGRFKGFTLHKNVECPKNRDGSVETRPLYELYLEDDVHQDAYIDLVALFNRRKDKNKKPEEFVDLFVVQTKRK